MDQLKLKLKFSKITDILLNCFASISNRSVFDFKLLLSFISWYPATLKQDSDEAEEEQIAFVLIASSYNFGSSSAISGNVQNLLK